MADQYAKGLKKRRHSILVSSQSCEKDAITALSRGVPAKCCSGKEQLISSLIQTCFFVCLFVFTMCQRCMSLPASHFSDDKER